MIFIVIPVHNRKEFTRNCIISLSKQTYKDIIPIVVDDGSTDGTEEMLIHEFPEVYIIKGDCNLWWTKAINLGVTYALENRANYILTLNNDTIATENFLEKMIYWAENTSNSILGAFAIDANTRKPLYGGEIINWKWAKYETLIDILPKEQWCGLHEVTHFPGRGLLIPAEVFRIIGLFDAKHFPHYLADYDFTHRAIRAGFKVYCNYDTKLYTYPDVSGKAENKKKKNIKNYYNHLFGITGGGNLKAFFLFALINCPIKYLLFFIPIGIAMRVIGYLRAWRRENLGKRL